jgi:NosR/NirI family nitrous oxide reductase transcriptional regulator
MPIRSVGSFWQHSTTLFDYIRRAMPYFEPQSLTNDEAYAVTAYVLFINNIITKDQNINADTLQKINMPNKAGFIDSWGPDWWRSWIHQKYSIIFTCFLLIGILLVILFARKLTQNKKYINIIKILLTTTIFSWIGIFHGIPIGTQKVYNSYNNVKLNNGDWENILFEPIFVILSSFVIITTLIWGRGIFCGWICPFGTIQDMIYKFKSFFKFITFEVPNNLHNKLIYTKYIILSAIVISAIYTSGNNLLLEFEPFKTIIENKFNTSTILILWSLVLLSFVFFIERGFCRYLCPTGAALSLTSQFQVINWLTSIKANGSKDSLAFAPRCPTKAIKSDGSINEKECILCLSCQIVYNDKNLSKRNKSSIRKKRNNNAPVLGTS